MCVLFIPRCGTSFQSQPAAKVGSLIGAERGLTTTRIKEAEEKNMVLSCLWSVYTLKMWQNELKHQKEREAFFVHSWFTLTRFFFLLLCVNYQLSKAYSQLLYYLPLSLFFFLEVWPSSFVNEDTTLSSSGHCVFSLPIMSVNGGLLQKWEEIRIGLSAFGVGTLMRWRWTGQKSTVCPGLFPRYLEERLIPFRPWDKRCEHETSLNLSRITDPSNWF